MLEQTVDIVDSATDMSARLWIFPVSVSDYFYKPINSAGFNIL